MGRKQRQAREAYLKGKWCDAITEFGENEFFEGRMTREEVNAFYRAIGKTHNMPDLIPVMTPAQLKKIIKLRRAHGVPSPAQEHPAWGEAPPPPAKNVINATKRFGDKALSRLKKTA